MVKFVDEVSIQVEAGHGGAGCLSFRRERCLPKGGPDGGDGGRGGDVILQADSQLTTLVDLRFKSLFKAASGRAGSGQNKTGLSGNPCVILVPVGTMVYDHDSELMLADLIKPGQSICVARGGEQGVGNARFKSSQNRAPRQFTSGESGESRRLKLALKVMADVGLVGLPNAGKSSLVRAVSSARPKVADYPFTTTRPHLGVVYVDPTKQFVMADIPGLIAGAADGVGLGDQFLKHLSRCRILLHVVAAVDVAHDYNVMQAIEQVRSELVTSNEALAKKATWIVLSKIDLLPEEDAAQLMRSIAQQYPNDRCIAVSAVNGYGLKQLCNEVGQLIEDSI